LDGFLHAYVEGEVLDIGCGRGISYRYAKRIAGIDIHLLSLKKAGKLLEAGFEYVCNHNNVMLFRKRK